MCGITGIPGVYAAGGFQNMTWAQISEAKQPLFRTFVCHTHQGNDEIVKRPADMSSAYAHERLTCGCLVPLNQVAFKAIGKKGSGAPK